MMCIALPVSWGVSLGLTGSFPSLSPLPSPTPIPPNPHPLNLQPRRGPTPALSSPPLPEPLSFGAPSLSEAPSPPLSEALNATFVKRS